MNSWEGVVSQMLSVGMGQSQQEHFYASQAGYGAGFQNFCIGPSAGKAVKEKAPEPPTEFEQLSNHKFHELLAKFAEMI